MYATQEVIKEIAKRVAKGQAFKEVAADPEMPKLETMMLWQRKSRELYRAINGYCTGPTYDHEDNEMPAYTNDEDYVTEAIKTLMEGIIEKAEAAKWALKALESAKRDKAKLEDFAIKCAGLADDVYILGLRYENTVGWRMKQWPYLERRIVDDAMGSFWERAT